MGWNWAVWLAQTVLCDAISSTQVQGEFPFPKNRMLIKGGSPPQLSPQTPLAHYEYIDDFGLIYLTKSLDTSGIAPFAEAVKSRLRALGFDVHKEELGLRIVSLGPPLR